MNRQTKLFPWKRWWIPEDEELPLDADGFYAEPEAEFLRPLCIGRELSELREIPCLVLLGEAGMGKTTVVRDYVAATDGKACVIDLKTFSENTLDQLCKKIEAVVSTGVRELFFDSLDEAQLRSQTIFYSLVRTLDQQSSPTLAVRIVCRAAEWPRDGSSEFEQLYGNGAVGVWHLAPLSCDDVREAAKARGINPDAFSEALRRAGVLPLAAVPITLVMLLNTFAEDPDLPCRATKIYGRAIDRLLRESNEIREKRHAKGMLDPKDRLAVAERLAACSVFCSRPIILGTVLDQPFEGVLVADEITDGPGEAHAGVRVTKAAVQEVLTTALFRGDGKGGFEFLHRTHAEYLAARWAKPERDDRLLRKQLAQLLRGTQDDRHAVPPQLHGVAAWLAAADPELVGLIASSEPEILLESAHLLSHADRSRLVAALLEACERLEAFPERRNEPAYSRLNHPGLGEQLRPWVKGERGNRLARLAAIDIAGACRVEELQNELLALVENDGAEYDLRIRALRGLRRLPNVIRTDRLHDLALGKADNNPDDRLRGLALLYLWPGHLETAEVFRSVTPPRRTDLWSWYQRFVKHELVAKLPDEELPAAMSGLADLLAQQPRSGRHDSWFSGIAKGLLNRALKLDVAPDLTEAAARMLINGARTNLLHPEQFFRNEELTDMFRRVLVHAIVASDECSELAVQGIFFDLIRAEDLSWLLDELRDAGTHRKKTWAELASWAWVRMGRTLGGYELLYEVAVEEPALRARLTSWMDGIDRESEEARHSRESWECEREWKRYDEEVSAENWTCEKVRETADRHLNLAVSSDPYGWCELVRLLGDAWPTDLRRGEEDPPPFAPWKLETYPAFACLDDPLRARLAEAADRYLQEGDPGTEEPESWWSRTDRPDWHPAAVAALDWLRDHAPSVFTRLPAEVWARWAPAIVEHGDHEAEPGTALADVCYRLAPEALLSALCERLELRLSRGETEYALLRLAKRLEDDRVLGFLAEQLRAEGLSPQAAFEIAQMLAEKRPDACEDAIQRSGEGHAGG